MLECLSEIEELLREHVEIADYNGNYSRNWELGIGHFQPLAENHLTNMSSTRKVLWRWALSSSENI